ncbi:MAG: hypothetical protein DRP46_03250 [Candidatus Zixiibacteriota bacterium]|nr:MAG: hypothetical protein DRP46_03250 [candidate division Zixibacteria bacterium]HDL02794.1 O-antigen ligase family protein [candidate division Zixibacteria bacterium]
MINRLVRYPEKGAAYALFGYFFSSPFSHALGQIFCGLALFLIIVQVIMDKKVTLKPKIGTFGILILLFILWSAISALVSQRPLGSLFSLKEEWLFMMIPAAAYLSKDEKVLRICLRLFAISVMIISLYGIWQHFTGIDFYHDLPMVKAAPDSYGYRARGNFTHRMTFGNYYALASMLLLGIASCADNCKSRIFYCAGFALAAIASILSFSRGAQLAILITLIIFLIFFAKKSWRLPAAAMIVAAVIVCMLSPAIQKRYKDIITVELNSDYKFGGSRMIIWEASFNMVKAHPVFGVGQGNYGLFYDTFRAPRDDRHHGHAHNDILNVAAYAGIPAALIFIAFWAAIVYKLLKLLQKIKARNYYKGVAIGLFMATVIFFISSLYEATFADEEIRLFLMAVWGLAFGLEYLVNETGENAEKMGMTEKTEKA